MFPLNKTIPEYPKKVKEKIKNGWCVLWANSRQILLGKGNNRICYNYDIDDFFKVVSSLKFTEKGDKNEKKW